MTPPGADTPPSRPRRHVVLASASPRRRELLQRALAEFDSVDAGVDEAAVMRRHAGIEPERLAMELAAAKAAAVAGRFPDSLVLAGDTLVIAADGAILGKPADAEDARRILHALSGTTHRVITGLCLLDARDNRRTLAHEETAVTMRPLSERDIAEYIATGEPFGKAGAYAIQERGDRFVTALRGNFDTVVGLPVGLACRLLKEAGA